MDAEATERAIGALQRQVRASLSAQHFDAAVAKSDELRELVSEAYGPTRNPILAAALNDSALAHKGRGDFETAVEQLAAAVQQYGACGLADHPSTATALHNMGVSYKEHAQQTERSLDKMTLLERAAECLIEANDRRGRVPKAADDAVNRRSVATTRVVLASVRRQQQRRDDATVELDAALDVLRDSDGSPQASTALATALNNAGYFAKHDGDDQRALDMYREALDLRETSLGRDHPCVLRHACLISFAGTLSPRFRTSLSSITRLGVTTTPRPHVATFSIASASTTRRWPRAVATSINRINPQASLCPTCVDGVCSIWRGRWPSRHDG